MKYMLPIRLLAVTFCCKEVSKFREEMHFWEPYFAVMLAFVYKVQWLNVYKLYLFGLHNCRWGGGGGGGALYRKYFGLTSVINMLQNILSDKISNWLDFQHVYTCTCTILHCVIAHAWVFCSPEKAMLISVLSPEGYFSIWLFLMNAIKRVIL